MSRAVVASTAVAVGISGERWVSSMETATSSLPVRPSTVAAAASHAEAASRSWSVLALGQPKPWRWSTTWFHQSGTSWLSPPRLLGGVYAATSTGPSPGTPPSYVGRGRP